VRTNPSRPEKSAQDQWAKIRMDFGFGGQIKTCRWIKIQSRIKSSNKKKSWLRSWTYEQKRIPLAQEELWRRKPKRVSEKDKWQQEIEKTWTRGKSSVRKKKQAAQKLMLGVVNDEPQRKNESDPKQANRAGTHSVWEESGARAGSWGTASTGEQESISRPTGDGSSAEKRITMRLATKPEDRTKNAKSPRSTTNVKGKVRRTTKMVKMIFLFKFK
jgi:hypothetical protein